MAVLHKKEEKIQAVLGRLSKKYTHEEFVAMFIQLYSKDWGKIKSAYIKQSQDKEPGTVINMPKPELYLKQILESYLAQNTPIEIKEEVSKKPEEEKSAEPKKVKATTKQKSDMDKEATEVKTPKVVAKKKLAAETTAPVVKKTKVAKK